MVRLLFTICIISSLVVNLSGQTATGNNGQFRIRGFHLDLRIQPMKMSALREFARELHEKGINTLIMEWEATFPFASHPMIPNKYAYSKAAIDSFILFCGQLGIDVIPLQQSFGHVEYILRNYRYKELREDQENYSQVCPMKAELDRQLFTQLFVEMAASHPSKYFHIGGDETYLLGHCPLCKAKADKVGKSRLYIDYIRMLCEIVIGMGKQPVLWADIALKYPDAIEELPKGTIFVDWNYGWDMNRFGDHQNLVSSGYEIWGACSMRSHPDNYFLTVWPKHFQNISDFLPAARISGYSGMIMTSWSTSGQYSTLSESETDIFELYAIRHVYPIIGFDILLAAYAEGLNNPAPLNTNKFILEYATAKFGFDNKQANQFEHALMLAPYQVSQGFVLSPKEMSMDELLDSAKTALRILQNMKALKNQSAYQQFIVMQEIRLQYLSYEQIEIITNGPTFNNKNIPEILKRLELLLKKSKKINQEFENLNQGWYYPAVLREENDLRNQKLTQLYVRLARNVY
ncbi:MAG: family 20 glycosylhydrolase [Chitinophagales bacterium]